MLKEAIEKIEQMANPSVINIEGIRYVIDKDGGYTQIRSDLDVVDTINLTSLDAMVKFITTEAVNLTDSILYVTVPNHMMVRCFTSPDAEARNYRNYFYEANATDVPGWEPQMKLAYEEAQIALRTRFQPTNDTEYAIKLLSDISTGCKVTFNDNGVGTTIVTKTGVALQAATQIRPIINLRPYRTFQEVEQPASDFLIRVSDRYISFTEADGGMWKLHARQTIKEYLEKAMAEEIALGAVIVAL